MNKVQFSDWGLIEYEQAWKRQTELSDGLKAAKKEGKAPGSEGSEVSHHLIFCHHPHVFTLGKSGSRDHLLIPEDKMAEEEVTFFKINRGGDITYHGPGQLVGYPIFDLECFFRDVHKYVRNLEECIIRMLVEYGIGADRQQGYTGVWLPPDSSGKWRKICAIGVHLSRWVSMHGFALNVQPDLSYFGHIVPCGIAEEDKAVTSIAQELGVDVDMDELKNKLKKHFSEVFEYEYL